MPCKSCQEKRNPSFALVTKDNPYPFKARDINVIGADGSISKFVSDDWNNNVHKLLVVIPEAFTPVCQTELGAMSGWADEFQKLDCQLIAVCSDPVPKLMDWFQQEESLSERNWPTFSSYDLPSKLGLIRNGRTKRASVFITDEGEVVKQEHFDKVGRSFVELHRQMYAYTTGEYCGEGWQDPSDNLND